MNITALGMNQERYWTRFLLSQADYSYTKYDYAIEQIKENIVDIFGVRVILFCEEIE